MAWQQSVSVSNDDYIAFDEDETINLTNLRVDDIQEEKRMQINGLDDNDYESTITGGWSKEENLIMQQDIIQKLYVMLTVVSDNVMVYVVIFIHINQVQKKYQIEILILIQFHTGIRKYSPLKLTKKIQSTLDFPIVKASTNINKSTFNKCSDCDMLYYLVE
eukprot:429122_1